MLDELASTMTGELVRPGDATYDGARNVWNGMIDLRPAAIARCASTEDVQAALQVARDAGLPLAVRGGGHNVAGFGTVDDGLVIDLSPMSTVTVDAATRRVRAGGGATLKDLDAATQAHGLVVPAGVVSETGIAGLTLSGGLGWVRRKWGLSCDNLVGVELVTADGTCSAVDEQSDPELMWGLRGGGGNFGVVTQLVFDAHPLGPEVAFLFALYPLEQAHHVLAEHERLVLAGGDEVSTIAVLGHVPPLDDFPAELHEAPFVGVLGMYAGPADEGEQALQPFRELGAPLVDLSGPMAYVDAQQIYDPDYPAGHRYYWKSTNLPSLSDRPSTSSSNTCGAHRPSTRRSMSGSTAVRSPASPTTRPRSRAATAGTSSTRSPTGRTRRRTPSTSPGRESYSRPSRSTRAKACTSTSRGSSRRASRSSARAWAGTTSGLRS